jgi:hypothetical protein
MLLNFSNHPTNEWTAKQKNIALEQYTTIQDLSFPPIDPNIDSFELEMLVEKYIFQIQQFNPTAIHIMGEHTFTFKMVTELQKIDFLCIASTTERKAIQKGNKKTIYFDFVRFRTY